MDTSVLLNWIFGGGLLAALTALVTLGPTVRKAKAEAEKAKADAETVRIDNTEHATRILIENIVEPCFIKSHQEQRQHPYRHIFYLQVSQQLSYLLFHFFLFFPVYAVPVNKVRFMMERPNVTSSVYSSSSPIEIPRAITLSFTSMPSSLREI